MSFDSELQTINAQTFDRDLRLSAAAVGPSSLALTESAMCDFRPGPTRVDVRTQSLPPPDIVSPVNSRQTSCFGLLQMRQFHSRHVGTPDFTCSKLVQTLAFPTPVASPCAHASSVSAYAPTIVPASKIPDRQ